MEQVIKSYVKRHIIKYPKIETIDIYKMIYQASFLAGHIITDKAYDYLVKEADLCKNTDNSNNELYDYISDDVVRINLYPYLNYYSAQSLFELFKKCSGIDLENANLKINSYKNHIKDMLTVENRVLEYLVNDGYVNKSIPSHSTIYKSKYNPSYRIAKAKDISVDLRVKKLQSYIDSLYNKTSDKLLIALEGRCGSGKTTISNLLSNVTIIHVDDFFDEKKKQRLDYDRLVKLLNKLKSAKVGEKIEFDAFSCSDWSYHKKEITVNKIIVVEGVYSYSEEVREFFDEVVFSVISKEVQLERLTNRENEFYLQKYLNVWIPREEEYYNTFDFVSNANILI